MFCMGCSGGRWYTSNTMANGTKKTSTKKKATQKKSAAPKQLTPTQQVLARVFSLYKRADKRRRNFLSRRSHRSFRRTRRRDYVRKLELPGYLPLVQYVYRMLHKHRRTFLLLVLTYTVIIVIVGGITSQDTYTQIQDLLSKSGNDLFGSGIGTLGQAGLLAVSSFAGLPSTLTADQQIYLGIGIVFAWLSTVWLLREYMLGRTPRLRDGLYNSGSPFLATVTLLGVIIFQLIPIGIVAIIYAGFASVGIVDDGFSSMLFWVFAGLVATLVLYWTTSSVFGLVIVTLPGMYPFRAIRIASDIVMGRRLRILLRLIWGAIIALAAWVIVLIPLIVLTSFVASAWPVLKSIPIVPYAGAILTAASTVWYAAYVYLFYRKVVDNE